MSILEKVDKNVGIFLRFLANLLTGNSFKRIEERLYAIEAKLDRILQEDAGPSSIPMQTHAMVKAMFDEQQNRTLQDFNNRVEANRK